MKSIHPNNEDHSPQLKRGEVKKLLVQLVIEKLPDFTFDRYKNNIYYFIRTRKQIGLSVVETLGIGHSLKEKAFYCSISSCINEDCRFDFSYNIGPLNPRQNLKVLASDTKVLSIEEGYHFHNGRINGTKKAIQVLLEECKDFAIPYLDERLVQLGKDEFIKTGLTYITNLKIEPQELKRELKLELKKADYIVSRIQHPNYIELRELLVQIKGGTKEYRQYIPKLAYELLELYCQTNVANK